MSALPEATWMNTTCNVSGMLASGLKRTLHTRSGVIGERDAMSFEGLLICLIARIMTVNGPVRGLDNATHATH
eukprot:CAMPEP_0202916260 /NCGR_PEP_ID=MMETSP1392-20130828/68115_1 /ASSEMBLY_ACC=CAM_ASM_000868 /TAXON_ID=225041 /ORGANISM="Chlamydomonas chlamydogama, Strain SAG 11-48b" /LENGTH=72 /DNA_ID=CAMNT_0049608623 /DNA_START=65 /DNA_END=279 /DNA_ORIENTATION=+